MQNPDMKKLLANSYLSGGNAAYLEELYDAFLQDPSAIDPEWRRYFESLPKVNGYTNADVSHAAIQTQFLQLAKSPFRHTVTTSATLVEAKQFAVNGLIDAYRRFGHLAAKLDPLKGERPAVPELTLEFHGLSSADNNSEFSAPFLFQHTAKLADICSALQQTYCRSIGFGCNSALKQPMVR